MLKKIAGVSIALLFVFTMFPTNSLAVERYEVLAIGDSDDWVYELQERLNELGYLLVPATGYFGTNTQNAVIKFQEDHDLSIDGKAGPETRKAVFRGNYEEIPPNSRSVKNAPASSVNESSGESSDSGNSNTLYPGDKGDSIVKLQNRLNELEYYEYSSITGYYGPVTEDAVKRFQRSHNLTQDGIMGPATYHMLFSDSARYYTMYPGDRGDDIRKMQERLDLLGYFNASATGYYGNATLKAVQSFQSSNGLTSDGKAGQKTRSILYSNNAVSASRKSSDESADSNSSGSGDINSSSGSTTSKMLEIANGQIGKPYSYGSSGPNSFDCSGFVYYAMKNSGVVTSRLSSASYSSLPYWTTILDSDSLVAGDLVFFQSDTSSTVSHMGIYVGGGSFIHAAPSSGVSISVMSSGYYLRNFVRAKRIL